MMKMVASNYCYIYAMLDPVFYVLTTFIMGMKINLMLFAYSFYWLILFGSVDFVSGKRCFTNI